MAKHTPGPWKVCGYNRAILQDKVSMDGCSLTIAELPTCMGPQHPNGYDEANATLMAAAPDLLEALYVARGYMTEANSRPEDYALVCSALLKAED